jgi:hypothetical protein
MVLGYGTLPVEADRFSPGPPRGLLVHLAATVRGRLEGASEVPEIERIVPRVKRAAWALKVAGVSLCDEPVGILEWLDATDDEDGMPAAPWSRWAPGEEVPPDARSRDLARALGVVRYRLEDALATGPEGCRTAALEGAWIVGQCLGIRPLLGPIGRDEVESMREKAWHAWCHAHAGVRG